MRGLLLTVEGLDGSGKGTQSRLLLESLREKGVPARLVSFPDYDHPSSALVKMYLAGEFGGNPGDVNAYAASSSFASGIASISGGTTYSKAFSAT